MRTLDLQLVTKSVYDLILDSCYNIEESLLSKIKKAIKTEANPLGVEVLKQIESNAKIAREDKIPMCQDTGMVVVFLEIGSLVTFEGDIYHAINEGVKKAYTEGYLRKSVVKHPLDRINTKDNTPAIIHTKIIPGEKVKITLAPKGGGAENVSVVKMLIPSDGIEGIKRLVLKTVFESSGKPCPPIIVGIGIGGNLEKSALIAKEALMRDIDDSSDDKICKQLETELLEEINKLGIGPMGFGGTTTALAVKVNIYPCHIASLPVAINIQCHAARHKTIEI